MSPVGSTGDPAVARGAVDPAWKAGQMCGVAAAALQGNAAAAAYGWYMPYPAARANSAAARSAARFRRMRLMELTLGAVPLVHTPEKKKKELRQKTFKTAIKAS